MPDYITTYTGIHFFPTNPNPEALRIADFAHALSLLCRGNGHVKSFFSVGQHCIACAREAEARGYTRRVVLACLLHDASEAYMSDVPRPFKKELPEYTLWENALLTCIYTRYLGSPLTVEEEALVKQIDDDLLWFDLTELLNEQPAAPKPNLSTPFSHDPVPFEEIEHQYLALYQRLKLTDAE